MRRDLWMILLLGCLLVLFLEAPVAVSSVTADLAGPYPVWAPEGRPSTESASSPSDRGSEWNPTLSRARSGASSGAPTLGQFGPDRADDAAGVAIEPRLEVAQPAERSS